MNDTKKLPDDRKKIWADYTAHLCSLNGQNDIGSRMRIAYSFLQESVSLNKRGYKAYIATHAADIAMQPRLKEGLLDFLAFLGVGYGRPKKEEVAKLEKLSAIDERNKKTIDNFVVHLTSENDLSPHTVRSFVYTARSFYEYANEFNQENCRRFIKTLEDLGNAPSTIRLKIVALRKLGEFLKIPIVLKKPKVQRTLHTENIPTEAEYYKLLEYLKSQNRLHYLYLKIIATTGARLSEFLRFKWGDILEGEVMLKGKGDKYRHFYFSPELQKEVKCYMKEQSLNTDVLVFMNRFGQPMSTRGVPELMKRWGAKCGIDKSKMHPHALRHFFAKMYLKKTKDIVQLADFLGHANIDTTRIYLQKSHEEQKRNFNRNITW